jgi:quercetin dioxygenase-like cupin family protein
MRIKSVALLFSTIGLVFLELTSPGLGDSTLNFEPLILAPYETTFVQNGSCPNGQILKVTGAIRGLDRRKACVSIGRQAGVSDRTIGKAATPRANELETVKQVFQRAIPTIPGKNLTAVVVSYPPRRKSHFHRHAKSAFIYAFVLNGAIRVGIGSQRPVVYEAGDSFYEEPGALHTVSENASNSEPASLLAVLIVDSEDHPLTLSDPSAETPLDRVRRHYRQGSS